MVCSLANGTGLFATIELRSPLTLLRTQYSKYILSICAQTVQNCRGATITTMANPRVAIAFALIVLVAGAQALVRLPHREGTPRDEVLLLQKHESDR